MFAGIEGSRPVLVEIQALVAPSPLGTPRRAVVGWDSARLAMVLAVLEARCGVAIGANDVYLNIAGRACASPSRAADLAVAAGPALLLDRRAGARATPWFSARSGSVAEVRAVGQTEARLKEAAKAGLRPGDPAGAPGGARTPTRRLRLERSDHFARHWPTLDALMPLFGDPVSASRG